MFSLLASLHEPFFPIKTLEHYFLRVSMFAQLLSIVLEQWIATYILACVALWTEEDKT